MMHESGADGELAGTNAGVLPPAPPWFYPAVAAAVAAALAPINERDLMRGQVYNNWARERNNNKGATEPLLPLKNSSNELPSPTQLHFPTTLRELDKLSLARCNDLLTFYGQPLKGNVAQKRTDLAAFIRNV